MRRDRIYYLLLGIVMMLGFVATRGQASFWDGLGWGLGLGAIASFIASWVAWKAEPRIAAEGPSE